VGGDEDDSQLVAISNSDDENPLCGEEFTQPSAERNKRKMAHSAQRARLCSEEV